MIRYKLDLQFQDGTDLRTINIIDTDRSRVLAQLENALGSSVPIWITLNVLINQYHSRYVHGSRDVIKYLMTGDRSLFAKRGMTRKSRMNFNVGEWKAGDDK